MPAQGPASVREQARKDARAVREWATEAIQDWAKGEDEAEVVADCCTAFIDSEIDHNDKMRATALRQELGL